MKRIAMVAASSLSIAISSLAYAGTNDTLKYAIKEGDTTLLLRYRYEFVDQDGISNEAHASTLLSRMSFTSGNIAGFSATGEVDNVSVIGSENYNNTINGYSSHPVVADPDGTEVNQAYLQYVNGSLILTGGRQRINLDDQRFIGGVGWRQNEQTYDGYRAQYNFQSGVLLDVNYVYNVNRIFGEDSPNSDLHGNIYLLNSTIPINDQQSVQAFAYLLDFDNAAQISSQTYGLRYQGQFSPFKVSVSIAQQMDYANSSNSYDALYGLLELSGQISGLNWLLGYELLGEDNGTAMSTPLATGHKFQGFADKFLSTPTNGIQDFYISTGGTLAGLAINATYHQFESDRGSIDYGDELDLTAAYPLSKNCKLLLKYARYNADTFASDTDKFWLMFQLNL